MFNQKHMKKMFDSLRPLRRMDYASLRKVIRKNDCVLDYGCGRMPYKDAILKLGANYKSADITGSKSIDFSINGHGELEGCDEVFDVIIIMDVLQHIVEPRKTLTELTQYLSKDATVIITTPFIFVECDFHDYHRWSHSGIHALLTSAGYTVTGHDKRGGTFFASAYIVLGTLSNVIIWRRLAWRLKLSVIRRFALVLLETIFIPILWFALFLDYVIPINGGYLGTITVAKKG